jgi:hypothetical protein
MDRLEATELLDLWERGLAQSPPRRIAALLRAAWPDASCGDVLDWPLGLRDARLLALRRRLFGSDLTLVSRCPSCGDAVETTFSVDDVLLPDDARAETVDQAGGTIARSNYTVAFRLPTLGDVVAIAEGAPLTPATVRERLLARCVDVRAADGSPAELSAVPFGVIDEIVDGMAEADPQADVQLACVCPACDRAWLALFDIATVLWTEIHAWARQLLRDVHVLARAYGWRESDIVTLSPTRRRMYLELAAR